LGDYHPVVCINSSLETWPHSARQRFSATAEMPGSKSNKKYLNGEQPEVNIKWQRMTLQIRFGDPLERDEVLPSFWSTIESSN